MKITRALIIDKPWIDLILSGDKTWEMRSRPTKIRGRIGLIEKGSGLIVGECELINSSDSFSTQQLIHNFDKHKVKDMSLLKKWRCPWVLENAVKYDNPIPYKHPQGAVVWVKVEHAN